jgi:hypothetical protein
MAKISKKANAAEIAGKRVHQAETFAILKATLENVEKGYCTDFVLHAQVLVTKVGAIVSECLISPNLSRCYYCGALSYLCNTVLGDTRLYDEILNDGINDKGNNVKHGLKSVKATVNISQFVSHYNQMITELVGTLNLNVLNDLKIQSHQNAHASGNQAPAVRPQNVNTSTAISHQSYKKGGKPNNLQSRKEAINITPTGLKLECSFVPEEGIIEKGFWNKRKVVRFGVRIKVNSQDCKVKSITGEVKCDGNVGSLGNLHTGLNICEVDQSILRLNKFSIVVSVVYKISLFSSKTQTTTILGTY